LHTSDNLETSPTFGGTVSSVGSEVVVVSTDYSLSEPSNGLPKACTASEAFFGIDGSLMSTLVLFDGFTGKTIALELASRAATAICKRILNVGIGLDDLSR
jgi:hypothetical protein